MLERNPANSLKHRIVRLQNSMSFAFGPRHFILQPDPKDQQILDDCLRRLEVLSPLPHGSTPAEKEWNKNRQELRNNFKKRDPGFFLNWPVVRRTMFVGNQPFVATELQFLQSLSDWQSRWETALFDNGVGDAEPSEVYPPSNPNVIHHAYTFSQFEMRTGSHIADYDLIIEFGGGYGNFCKLCHRLGFKGRYVIVDFPEFLILQHYFLATNGISVRDTWMKDSSEFGVYGIGDLEGHDILKVADAVGQAKKALFVGMWSLSETSINFREMFAEKVRLRSMQNFLFAFQDAFNEADNQVWFKQFVQDTEKNRKISWAINSIAHLKGNHYAFGVS